MERFLSLGYYFTARPNPDFQFSKLTGLIVALFFVAAIALRIYRKRYLKDEIWKRVLKRYPAVLQNYGIVLLTLWVIRETGMPYLSMRIWWALWALALLYSAVKFLLNYKKEYMKRADSRQKNHEKSRYLPKHK